VIIAAASSSACRSTPSRDAGATSTASSGAPASAPAAPSDAKVTPAAPSSASAGGALDPKNLFLSTTAETNERVRRVFPKGVASEDARAEIGTAPAPPEGALDAAIAWVVEIVLAESVSEDQLRAALAPAGTAKRGSHDVRGRLAGSERWVHCAGCVTLGPGDAPAARTFDRIAVMRDFVEGERATTAAEFEAEAAWARALGTRLKARETTVPMATAVAVKKAGEALAAKKLYSEEALDVSVVVEAAKGRRFPGRLVWDAAYSAGFSWGDGDYFHWVPSPQTDVSQGIGMGSGTGPGYFQPEALDSPSGDVENLEMSFNAARVWKPTQVVEVMAHAASYLARRLGGKVVGPDGKPFDASAAQAKVAAIERALTARGVVPGSELACQLF
jgi:hypothetical protein